ncbi:MAG: phosphotransferase enzyme family protein, partial [Acidimicrobiales bacterium]
MSTENRPAPGAAQPTEQQLEAAARDAAEAWGLDVAELELVSLSENVVFRVDTARGDRQALRLPRPGYNSLAEMESELIWVEALRGAGIDAPTPLRAAGGEGYVEVRVPLGSDDPDGTPTGAPVDSADAPPGHEVRLAGLIEWVDGVNLDELLDLAILAPTANPDTDVDEVIRRYHRIGGLLAALRRHGETWDPPPGFTRRRWDADGLVGPDPLWGRFWEVPTERSDRELFNATRAALHRRLSGLPTDRTRFGLVHADLHSRNVMVDGDRMIIIDFDDAGFGWYVHELAVAIEPVLDESWAATAHAALIEGYRSVHPLGDDEVSLIDAFCTIRKLMTIGWLAARPELGLDAALNA